MKELIAVLAILGILIFQNCAKEETMALPGPQTQENPPIDDGDDESEKVLGLYNYQDIASLKYIVLGGMISIHYDVVVNLGATITAEIVKYDNEVFVCSKQVTLNEASATTFKQALLEAYLAMNPPPEFMVSDCPTVKLQIFLKGSSSHTHTFDGGVCTPSIEVIKSGAHPLVSKFEGLADQNVCP